MQVAEILAVEGPKNEITILLVIRDETEGSEIGREFLDWDHTVWRVSTDNSLGAASANYCGVRL